MDHDLQIRRPQTVQIRLVIPVDDQLQVAGAERVGNDDLVIGGSFCALRRILCRILHSLVIRLNLIFRLCRIRIFVSRTYSILAGILRVCLVFFLLLLVSHVVARHMRLDDSVSDLAGTAADAQVFRKIAPETGPVIVLTQSLLNFSGRVDVLCIRIVGVCLITHGHLIHLVRIIVCYSIPFQPVRIDRILQTHLHAVRPRRILVDIVAGPLLDRHDGGTLHLIGVGGLHGSRIVFGSRCCLIVFGSADGRLIQRYVLLLLDGFLISLCLLLRILIDRLFLDGIKALCISFILVLIDRKVLKCMIPFLIIPGCNLTDRILSACPCFDRLFGSIPVELVGNLSPETVAVVLVMPGLFHGQRAGNQLVADDRLYSVEGGLAASNRLACNSHRIIIGNLVALINVSIRKDHVFPVFIRVELNRSVDDFLLRGIVRSMGISAEIVPCIGPDIFTACGLSKGTDRFLVLSGIDSRILSVLFVAIV